MAREMDNRRSGTRRSNPRREGRAQAAERHVADVAARCAREIERSIEGTVEIDGMPPAGMIDDIRSVQNVTNVILIRAI